MDTADITPDLMARLRQAFETITHFTGNILVGLDKSIRSIRPSDPRPANPRPSPTGQSDNALDPGARS